MVASAAVASIFPVYSPKPHFGSKTSGKHGNELGSLNMHGIKTKTMNSGGVVKASSQVPTEGSASKTQAMNGLKTDDNASSHASGTFINQLPDWSMLLAAITTIFLAAEKQWMMLDWKPKRPDGLADLDPWGLGRMVQDSLVFRQNFIVRSYEVGADQTTSIETLVNHMQETSLNHVKYVGLMGDGFGSTPEMFKKNLFWAVTKMRVLVDRYPNWGDVVQVDTWVGQNGKNSMRRDWLLRDCKTSEIITRASSNWVMMNKETRRLSKIPNEVRSEIERYFVDAPPAVDDDCKELPKLEDTTADYVMKGLTPRWSDLDINQHVNNVKYIGWILESVPHIVEKYELASITLEYRKECKKDSVVKSLMSMLGGSSSDDDRDNDKIGYSKHVDCQHVLLFEGGGSDGAPGDEIVKGRTEWRLKYENQIMEL